MALNKRWLRALLIIIPVGLLVGRWGAVTIANYEWAASLGVGTTHATILKLRLLLFLFAFLTSAIWFSGNFYLVYRSIGSVHVPRRLGDLEIVEAVPRTLLLVVVFGLGIALAFAVSHSSGSWWYTRALAGAERFVGLRDPILGRDVAYYLFQLPWQRTLHGFTLILSGVSLAAAGILYAAVGAVHWEKKRLRITTLARYHLAGLLLVFGLALFWGYRLEPAEYLAGVHNVPVDSILTDLRIPASRVLSGLALIATLASAAWIRVRFVSPVVVAWSVLALTSFAVHYVVPAMMAASRSAEALVLPYVEAARRDFADYAYGMVETDSSRGGFNEATPADLSSVRSDLRLVPVWDQFAANLALNRAYNARASDTFFRSYLVDLNLVDSTVPAYVGVRAVDMRAANEIDRDLSWESVHTGEYAQAHGVAAMLAAQTGAGGRPVILSENELAGFTGVPELSRVPLRFGPDMSEFAVLSDTAENAAGVRAGRILHRVMMGWALQSHHIITSSAVKSESRIVWKRRVTDRLRAYAPFADFDDVFPVLSPGGILWVAHGYVSAGAFPLSEKFEWQGRDASYLRAGFLGTVDASTGETDLYLVPDPDPLSRALADLMPDLVKDWADVPAVVIRHLQYPRQLFERQLAMLEQRLVQAQDSVSTGMEFSHLEPSPWFDPRHQGAGAVNLAGVLQAGPTRQIVSYAAGTVRQGRYQLQARYDDLGSGSGDVGERLAETLSSAGGIPGSLRVVPVAGGVLAYLSNFESPPGEIDPPRISSVAVSWRGSVARGADLQEAFARVARGSPPDADRTSSGVLAEVRRWFIALDSARRDADWVAFGRAWENLKRLLTQTGSVP